VSYDADRVFNIHVTTAVDISLRWM